MKIFLKIVNIKNQENNFFKNNKNKLNRYKKNLMQVNQYQNIKIKLS